MDEIRSRAKKYWDSRRETEEDRALQGPNAGVDVGLSSLSQLLIARPSGQKWSPIQLSHAASYNWRMRSLVIFFHDARQLKTT
jgi:hypothetical protein